MRNDQDDLTGIELPIRPECLVRTFTVAFKVSPTVVSSYGDAIIPALLTVCETVQQPRI